MESLEDEPESLAGVEADAPRRDGAVCRSIDAAETPAVGWPRSCRGAESRVRQAVLGDGKRLSQRDHRETDMTLDDGAISRLREHFAGELFRPADAGFAQARAEVLWNGDIARQPALIAMRAAAILVTMPPELYPSGASPAIASISGVSSRTSGMSRAEGSLRGSAV